MHRALQLAAGAAAAGEVPVGAVVMQGGREVAAAANLMVRGSDPTAHAEIVALRRAGEALATSRLDGCDLWVTLEPCAMCAGAIALARIRRLFYAAPDPKAGAVEHGVRLFASPACHHRPEVYPGIGEEEAARLLREFFRERRG